MSNLCALGLCTQIYQHLYLGFLYGLLAIKSIFIDDMKMLASGHIGNVPVNHIHLDELIIFFAGKGFYLFYYFVLPLTYSRYGILSLIPLWLIAHLVTGWVLAFMFQVSTLLATHKTSDKCLRRSTTSLKMLTSMSRTTFLWDGPVLKSKGHPTGRTTRGSGRTCLVASTTKYASAKAT